MYPGYYVYSFMGLTNILEVEAGIDVLIKA